jgi:hypothetical protein
MGREYGPAVATPNVSFSSTTASMSGRYRAGSVAMIRNATGHARATQTKP